MKKSTTHYKKSLSIRTTVLLAFMILILVVIISVSMTLYRYTINDYESISIKYTQQLISEINSSIDAYINNVKSIATVVVQNEDVSGLMREYNDSNGNIREDDGVVELKKRAMDHMNLVANTRDDITNIAILSKYDNVILSDEKKSINQYSQYKEKDWFINPLSNKEEIFISPSHVQNLISGEYKWVISISKAIVNTQTGETTGVMVIDMNYRSIEKICENLHIEDTGYIYLIDSKRNLIYHPQQPLIYSGVKNEDFDAVFNMKEDAVFFRDSKEDKIIMRDKSYVTGWNAVGVINRDNLLSNRKTMINFFFWLVYIVFMLAMIFAVLISKRITDPIKKLERTMKEVEQGDLLVRAKVLSGNEIGHLSHSFNMMVDRVNMLMDNVVKGEEEKRNSEILALQAQINPHFLYNTLDTIIWMSAGGKSDEVVEVTSALADLFRTSISQGNSLVKMEVEIQNIQSYLTIQKMRYKDKLSYSIDVPSEFNNFLMPKLILQPIVENAIYHGIKLSPKGGTIKIFAKLDDLNKNNLLIFIEDNGAGMSRKKLDNLLNPKQDGERGIGVLNVQNRIQLLFGSGYGLDFKSKVGEGTTIVIRIPIVLNDE